MARVCTSCGHDLAAAGDRPAPLSVTLPQGPSEVSPPLGPARTVRAVPLSFAAGRYGVQRPLGEGGQKAVYLVHDEALDRDCALALLKTGALDTDSLWRVQREAQAMARLTHPNIVTVFDIGEEDGRPYIVCEYVPGGDLRQELRKAGGPLALDRALAITRDIAQALAFAHGQGIVHRDVKPGNVWLASDGAAKLGDFGLALSIDRTRLTIAGTVMGTAAYMPPEQAQGQPVDGRSDLYALGCLLYELVTGRPPFLGDDPIAVISQHVHVPPPPPSQYNPDIPGWLESLLLKLLAKAREERPASAQDVLAQLDAATQPEAVEALPTVRPLHRLARAPFVGRQQELAALKAALEQAISGKGSLQMLAGEPGVGKTRLAQELALYAQLRGAKVLVGRCTEGEGAPAYWPWIQIIRSYAQDRHPEPLRAEMGPGAADIVQVVPDIGERLPGLPPPPPLEPEQARFRLFDSITTFFKSAAKAKALLLILDDLQWADKPSLLLLQFLARELAGARLLVLGAYRDVDLDRAHPLAEALAALRSNRLYERISIRGLTQENVRALVAAFGEHEVSEALAQALYKETEGNPFFVEEILKHLVEEEKIHWERGGLLTIGDLTIEQLGIPEGVREVIGRRLARLSEPCNRLLIVGSTMPGGFGWEIMTAVSGEEEDRLLDLLDEALAAQLIRERKEAGRVTYDFTHALIRQTLYSGLSTPRRQRLHLRVGEAVEGLAAEEFEALAYHFSQAGGMAPLEKTRRYLTLAGDKARRTAAWEEAASYYLQALDVPLPPAEQERAELLRRLGEAQSGQGDWDGAVVTWKDGMELFERLGDKEAVGWIGYSLRKLYGARGQFPEAAGVVQQSLTVLGEADSEIRARLLAQAGFIRSAFGETQEAERLLAQSLEIAQRLDNPAARGFASFVSGMHCLNYCRLTEAADWLHQGAQWSRSGNDVWSASQASSFRRRILFTLGKLAEAEQAMDEEETLARRAGNFLAVCETKWLSSQIACLRGDLPQAEALATQLLELIRTAQADSGIPGALINLSHILFLRGDWEGFEDLISQAISSYDRMSAAPIDDPRPVLLLLRALAGRAEQARALLPDIQRYFSFADPWTISLGEARTTLAAALAVLGEKAAAANLYQPLKEWTSVSGYVLTGASSIPQLASRVLGMVAAASGQRENAAEHFETALRQAQEIGATTELAEASYWYARFLVDSGRAEDRDRARDLLAQAAQIWDQVGMTAHSAKARDLETMAAGG